VYKLRISAHAKNELKRIPRKHCEPIIRAFIELSDDPFLGKPLTRELTGKFSYRIGFFRIIYTVNKQDKIVQIITIGHRSIVYN
jgi:mRNA-degrading endonuclease RelE of RelBE toxin-antitoxin system